MLSYLNFHLPPLQVPMPIVPPVYNTNTLAIGCLGFLWVVANANLDKTPKDFVVTLYRRPDGSDFS